MQRNLKLAMLAMLLIGGVLPGINSRTSHAAGLPANVPNPSKQDQHRPNIEKQNDQKSNDEAKASSAAKDGKVARSSPPAPRATRKKPAETHRKLPSEYTLTLAANVPEADVIVDGEKLGTTGKDGRLKTPMKAGRRTVTVVHPDYRSVSKPIDVGPGLVEVSFQLEERVKPVAMKEVATSPPPSLPEPGSAASADSILQRFIETPRPDVVSTDEWKDVLSQSEKNLARDPKNVQAKCRMLFAQGQLAYDRREYTLALVAFTEAIQNYPDYALAHFGSGNCYSAAALPHEALREYQRTVQLLPNFALGHKALGDLLSKGGRRKEGNDSYRRAKQLGYSQPEVDLLIAQNLVADRLWNQALEQLKPLIEKSPSADAWFAVAECYEALKYEFSAAMAYSRVVDLDKNNAIAHYRLGAILFGQHEYWSAQYALERAIALDPGGEKINAIDARKKANEAAEKLHK